jgi:transcriptional regulator with XRE-family HTH domain
MAPDRVKQIRKAAGLKQEQLAQILGTTAATISRWERGVAPVGEPKASLLRRIEERQQEAERWEETKERLLRAVAAGGMYAVLSLLFNDSEELENSKDRNVE